MGRSPSSFAKRQRELAKKERQEQKAAKRAERKQEPGSGPEIDTEVVREKSIVLDEAPTVS